MDSKRSRRKARAKNYVNKDSAPKTDSDFARRLGVTTPVSHHDREKKPVRRRLAHCVGF
jgi:hypothetical protein